VGGRGWGVLHAWAKGVLGWLPAQPSTQSRGIASILHEENRKTAGVRVQRRWLRRPCAPAPAAHRYFRREHRGRCRPHDARRRVRGSLYCSCGAKAAPRGGKTLGSASSNYENNGKNQAFCHNAHCGSFVRGICPVGTSLEAGERWESINQPTLQGPASAVFRSWIRSANVTAVPGACSKKTSRRERARRVLVSRLADALLPRCYAFLFAVRKCSRRCSWRPGINRIGRRPYVLS